MNQRFLRHTVFTCSTLACLLLAAKVYAQQNAPETIPIPQTVLPFTGDMEEGPLRITIPNVDVSKQETTPISSRALHLLFSRFLKENQQREVLAQPLPVLSISTPSTSIIYSVISRFVAVAADDGTPPAWQAILTQKASNALPLMTAVPSLQSMHESFELARIYQRPESPKPIQTAAADPAPEPKKHVKSKPRQEAEKSAKKQRLAKKTPSKEVKPGMQAADSSQPNSSSPPTQSASANVPAQDFSIVKLFDQLFIEDRPNAIPAPQPTQLVLNVPESAPEQTAKKKDKKTTVTVSTNPGQKPTDLKKSTTQSASLEVRLEGEEKTGDIGTNNAAPVTPVAAVSLAADPPASAKKQGPANVRVAALPWQSGNATQLPSQLAENLKEKEKKEIASPKPEFFFSKLFMRDASHAGSTKTDSTPGNQAKQMANLAPAAGGEPPAAQDLSGEVLVPSTPDTPPAPIPPRPPTAQPAQPQPEPEPQPQQAQPAKPTPEEIAREMASERQRILSAAPPPPAQPQPQSVLTAEEQELLKAAPPAPAVQEPAPPSTPEPQPAQVATPENAPEPVATPTQAAQQAAEQPVAMPPPAPTPAQQTQNLPATPPPQQEEAQATAPAPRLPAKPPSAKELLANMPDQLTEPRSPEANKPFTIDRTTTAREVFDPTELSEAEQAAKHEAIGVKIEIKTPRIDVNYELEKAYNSLMQGQTTLAKDIYNNVLQNDPNNVLALFGLATTYHRNGEFTQARTLYAKILTLDPDNRDALNNFLALVSSEVPHEALSQLEKLEVKNPDFSPIPAQMAIIYQKLGNPDKAIQKMLRAVSLEPENLTYRYNLAVLMDRVGKRDEAAALYRQLVSAHHKGALIPGNIRQIQERLTFLSSNRR